MGGIKIFATTGEAAVLMGLILKWDVDCRLSPKKIILRYLENVIFYFFLCVCRALTSKSNSLKIPLWTIFPNEILCGFAENKPIFCKSIIMTLFFLSYKSL